MDAIFNNTAAKKNKLSLTDKAYIELKRRILENELPPGTQLMEVELAELLNISRTPAREAMTRLEAEGFVEIRSRHGMKVKPVSVSDMYEIYAVLTGLESTAAWQAAKLNQPKEAIEALREAVKKMDKALEDEDLKAWAISDEQFHRLLVSMSGNLRLINLVDRFIDQSHRVRMMTLSLRPLPEKSNEDHAAVVAAIEAGDADAARCIHRKHREKSGELLVSILEKHNFTQL